MTLDRWIELESVQGHVNRPHPENAGLPYKIKNLPAFKNLLNIHNFLKPKSLFHYLKNNSTIKFVIAIFFCFKKAKRYRGYI